jgi:hypothetical protein
MNRLFAPAESLRQACGGARTLRALRARPVYLHEIDLI